MVVHEMNRGGIENFIMNLYRTIDKTKIQFDFVEHTEKKCAFDDDISALGGKIYHCPDYRVINHSAYSKWWSSFFCNHPEYKMIHSHLDSCANIHLRIAKKYGRITIAHSHSSSEGFGIRAIVKSILKINFNHCCSYKFACSEEAAKWLYKNKQNEAEIIKNGIDADKYTFNSNVRAEYRKKLNIPESEIVLGHIGRIDKNKNHAFIIDVLKALNDLGLNATFVSAGKGDELDNIKQKAKQSGIENKVIFLGLRKDVPNVLQAFDIFIMPSMYEGLPVSAIEAQAAGLKCLLSDVITAETNVTGLVAFMSLNDSALSWAKTIQSMLPYERTDTSAQIRNAGYDIQAAADYLTNFYLDL